VGIPTSQHCALFWNLYTHIHTAEAWIERQAAQNAVRYKQLQAQCQSLVTNKHNKSLLLMGIVKICLVGHIIGVYYAFAHLPFPGEVYFPHIAPAFPIFYGRDTGFQTNSTI
jgi:hypothetical protein